MKTYIYLSTAIDANAKEYSVIVKLDRETALPCELPIKKCRVVFVGFIYLAV